MLVDGFKCVSVLKERNPEAHKLLSETVLRFRDIGSDFRKFNKLNRNPIFVYGPDGKIKTINWSHFAR